MKSTNENISVFVKSRKVLVAMTVVEDPHWTIAGTFKFRRFILQYDNRLDTGQLEILEQARKLAGSAGVSLEIVDLSRMNFISRFAKLIFTKMPRAPSIVIPGALLSRTLISKTREPVISKLRTSNELTFSRLLQKG